MKHFFPFIAMFILSANYICAQGIAISDQASPSVSAGAVLDVSSGSSSAKGFLLPRILNEKNAIPKASRSDGLLYYFTGTKSFGYYSPGKGWYSFVISGPYLGSDEVSSDSVAQNVMFTPLGGQAIKMTNISGVR